MDHDRAEHQIQRTVLQRLVQRLAISVWILIIFNSLVVSILYLWLPVPLPTPHEEPRNLQELRHRVETTSLDEYGSGRISLSNGELSALLMAWLQHSSIKKIEVESFTSKVVVRVYVGLDVIQGLSLSDKVIPVLMEVQPRAVEGRLHVDVKSVRLKNIQLPVAAILAYLAPAVSSGGPIAIDGQQITINPDKYFSNVPHTKVYIESVSPTEEDLSLDFALTNSGD